jgi:hypothetical protein
MDVSKNVEITIDNCRDLTMPKRPSRWKHIIRTQTYATTGHDHHIRHQAAEDG